MVIPNRDARLALGAGESSDISLDQTFVTFEGLCFAQGFKIVWFVSAESAEVCVC